MNLNLLGKNALVCGSSQGIGLASAQELALLGANVVLVARNQQKLEDAVKTLDKSQNQTHRTLVADFSDAKQLTEALTHSGLNQNPIHILINNTGGPPAGPAHRASAEDFLQAFNNHLLCNHALVTYTLEGMKQAQYGRIINIISTSVKQPLDNLGVSNTIRGAVANWAKTLANELGQFGITVNNVLPGATMTSRLEAIISKNANDKNKSQAEVLSEMEREVPVRRVGQADEIAAAVAFLATPAAAYINGINLPVDGGRTKSL